jgi:hypothetical protein
MVEVHVEGTLEDARRGVRLARLLERFGLDPHALVWKVTGEAASAPLFALYGELRPVPLQHVLHDREAEP